MEKFVIGMTRDVPPGKRLIVTLKGRSIGVFNVNGTYYALRNVCPHQGAPLCAGAIVGMTFPSLPSGPEEYLYGREGEILRCPWHGWEFDLTNGKSIVNPHKYRVKTYEVAVEEEKDLRVETYPVTVDAGRIVVSLGQRGSDLFRAVQQKRDFSASYDRYCIVSGETLTPLREASGTLQEILQNFFQARVEEAVNDPERRGCFMVNAALEMAPHDPEVAQRVQAGLAATEEAFYHVLIKAQAKGELAWTYDPHQYARFLLNTLVGMCVLARANPDRRTLEQIVETALLPFR